MGCGCRGRVREGGWTGTLCAGGGQDRRLLGAAEWRQRATPAPTGRGAGGDAWCLSAWGAWYPGVLVWVKPEPRCPPSPGTYHVWRGPPAAGLEHAVRLPQRRHAVSHVAYPKRDGVGVKLPVAKLGQRLGVALHKGQVLVACEGQRRHDMAYRSRCSTHNGIVKEVYRALQTRQKATGASARFMNGHHIKCTLQFNSSCTVLVSHCRSAAGPPTIDD